jgi:protein O-mannosyl-transferase
MSSSMFEEFDVNSPEPSVPPATGAVPERRPPSATPRSSSARPWVIGLLLAAATWAVYWPVAGFDIVNLDDVVYVSGNPRVRAGLSWSGVAWAFSTWYSCNWHPLTWLSHMLDCHLFGLKAGAFHLINVAFHTLNTVLLFTLLRRMTRALWPSAAVAALFALHPLHVESVAWVSERKDVLSTMFWLLTLWAYVKYVSPIRGRGSGPAPAPASAAAHHPSLWYGLALAFFALGLLSKPMLVTLPFILLLLDYWPLERFAADEAGAKLPGLVVEKTPFLILSAGSCVVTYLAQQVGGAVITSNELPFSARLANAIVSYVRYLGKTLWPFDLTVYYTHPRAWPVWLTALALLVLLALTVGAFLARRACPYVGFGWLWYLGTLVPVIGLVQVGGQAMADRYTYVPLIGVFVGVVWCVQEIAVRWAMARKPALAAAAAFVFGCAVASAFQVRHWRNSEALFAHALNVSPDNPVAHNCLGEVLLLRGQCEEAWSHFAASARLAPFNPTTYYFLGNTLLGKCDFDGAIVQFKHALEMRPDYHQAHFGWGQALLNKPETLAQAEAHFREAIRCRPDYAEAWGQLGKLLALTGRAEEGVPCLEEMLRIAPDSNEAHYYLAKALVARKRWADAQIHFHEALRLKPDFADGHKDLASLLMLQGDFASAAIHYASALSLKPDAETEFLLANALVQRNEPARAVAHLRTAVKLQPNYAAALNDLAWLLASGPTNTIRNLPEALRSAEQACALTSRNNPRFLDTLATVYAEAGRLAEAVKTAQCAVSVALTNGEQLLAEEIRLRAASYQERLEKADPRP